MGEIGGLGGSYSTPMNVVGVGNPVPAGMNGQLGSGDTFTVNSKQKKISKKEPAYGEYLSQCVYLKK